MATFDLLLRGGTVIDGTGGPARRADVGVIGDRIAAVGAWTRQTSRRSWPCPGSPSAPMPRDAARDTGSWTRAGRIHARTGGVLGRYVRERGTLPLETAIAKLTSVPAERLGLRDRGVLRVGAAADMVAFDPATVADEATYLEPASYPTGISHVIVNGEVAIQDGVETGTRAGRLLRGTIGS